MKASSALMVILALVFYFLNQGKIKTNKNTTKTTKSESKHQPIKAKKQVKKNQISNQYKKVQANVLQKFDVDELLIHGQKYYIQPELVSYLKDKNHRPQQMVAEIGPMVISKAQSTQSKKSYPVLINSKSNRFAILTGTIEIRDVDHSSVENFDFNDYKILAYHPEIRSLLVQPQDKSNILTAYNQLKHRFHGQVELEILENFRVPK